MADGKKIIDKLMVPASKLPAVAKETHLQEKDFRENIEWRIFRIMAEIIDGFQFLGDFKKSVTFFGSARVEPGNPLFQEAQKLSSLLAKENFAVFSGGGPGIMEAANLGAFEAKGDSAGLNIQLKFGQRINPYITKAMGFHYFFTRKLMLSYSAQAFIFFPGGFGTMDEFFEIVTLIQTQKIPPHIPVICVGKTYWNPLLDWIKKDLSEKYQYIDNEDMKIYQLVDSAEEALEIIKNSKERKELFTS